jgi:hypothetical protein
VVSARRSSTTLWGRCPAVVERDISKKVYWTWRTDCMTSSVSDYNWDGFIPLEAHEGARLRSLSQDYGRYRDKI